MEQLSTTEIINIKYTEKQISEDIDYLIKSVEEVSPFPYMNADSLTIQALTKELKQKGDRMGNELYLDFMRLSAAFNVGHIYTFPPEAMLDEAIKNGDQFLMWNPLGFFCFLCLYIIAFIYIIYYIPLKHTI